MSDAKPARSRRAIIVAIAGLGVAVASLCASCLASIAIGVGTSRLARDDAPLTDAERAMILRAQDVVPLLEGERLDPSAATLARSSSRLGSWRLTYRYHTESLTVQTTVYRSPLELSARGVYAAHRAPIEELPNAVRCRARIAANCVVLRGSRGAYAIFIDTISGSSWIAFSIIGGDFDQQWFMDEQIERRLRAWRSYHPQ